uniref:dihydrofolate reductase n=1 Tax=Cellvibrio fontiphilus TaxID=1815559 RepID=UPI002B4C20ED|nr:dihydrofolate reductase [Cellvibrio fontiphilus]
MKLAIIVAAAKNGVIGVGNKLPWHLPQDLKYFKSVTMGKPVIMGRKTYESIGRILPGRVNIVVTRNKSWPAPEGLLVAHSLQDAIDSAVRLGKPELDEIMVIGGAELYREALPFADKVYLTEIAIEPDGDAFFSLSDMRNWSLESSTAGEELAPVSHRFLVYRRQAA